ncbi:hypothetical protein F5148DRAFT_1149914 [Russula earlei]|uniref:Uncharacterized protein n=1 Tax=Russula earlei TaxID=71964 RepID=A0ACC0U742_9AGAM|nr:hypothetical protein F5148DRAFT_1149914 [Russula earlei]
MKLSLWPSLAQPISAWLGPAHGLKPGQAQPYLQLYNYMLELLVVLVMEFAVLVTERGGNIGAKTAEVGGEVTVVVSTIGNASDMVDSAEVDGAEAMMVGKAKMEAGAMSHKSRRITLHTITLGSKCYWVVSTQPMAAI